MSGNTIGKLFTVTSFGESHGLAIGCIVDGCPPGLEISAADLQPDLDRRKPGQSTAISKTSFDRPMPITPTTRSMASEIIAAVDAVQRARPPCEWRQGVLLKNT
jgi:hypothetical protein